MCSHDEYSKWENGELLFDRDNESFITKEKAIEKVKLLTHWKSGELLYSRTDWNDEEAVNEILRENYYYTEEEYWDNTDYETFDDTYTTPNGEIIHAFGYYGHD
jgi:hypothetical protein